MWFAFAEAVTWAGMLAALLVRFSGATDALVGPAGGIHGFVFLTYCVATACVWIDGRWLPGTGLTGLLASVIPFATVFFELWADRRGLLAGSWRLGAGGEQPRMFAERVLAWALRYAALAIGVGVALVIAVFLVLLWLGPPVQF
ncbi:DUF3817 domain-containing protein [Leucobacter soli]|uniref:DUF3817 domain-containing protein n=1 Tax=Leucobacter soli TaxID=2812850 RepID=A0A916NI70_9MICO|nr:DUF3817 domain-containing protein [Leucobacter soli]CAG7619043.1 hypothetical protein LEUCIP111803_02257 [Leucobacter soli]